MIPPVVEFAGTLTASVWVIVQLLKPKKKAASRVWKPLSEIRAQNESDRRTPQYRAWRLAVLERDKYTCQKCGSHGPLEAHHIKPFAYYPELRYTVSNGQTLCHKDHVLTDSYGTKAKQNYSYH